MENRTLEYMGRWELEQNKRKALLEIEMARQAIEAAEQRVREIDELLRGKP